MTPLEGLQWVGVGFAAALALSLLVEAFRPGKPRMVRVDVVAAGGELVATMTHLVGEERCEVRGGGVLVSAETVGRKPTQEPLQTL